MYVNIGRCRAVEVSRRSDADGGVGDVERRAPRVASDQLKMKEGIN